MRELGEWRETSHGSVIAVAALVSSLVVSVPLSMKGFCSAWVHTDKQG